METYIVKELWRYFNVSTKKCNPIIPMKISYWDLTFVLSGSLTYIVNGIRYHMEKNDVLLIPGGSMRERQPNSSAHYVSFNFKIFNDNMLPKDMLYKNAVNEEIRGIISLFGRKELLDTSKSTPYDDKFRAKCAVMLNYILLEILDTISVNSSSKHVKNIIEYINKHVSEPISLNEISEHIHLTKEYTAYIFKNETQKTVTGFINERKMLCAKEMIINGEMPLKEIAAALGYENYSYFSKVFKKHFKTTPVNFRAEIRKSF